MNFKLNVGWLYPELMSTYGDRGNIFVLRGRCLWRKIGYSIIAIDGNTPKRTLSKCDIVIGGGAQDRQQEIAIKSLLGTKDILQKLFETGVPGLFVCGSPQLLGHTYTTGDGIELEGLGIFDMVTKHFGKDQPRCIGNTIAEVITENLENFVSPIKTIVGFENHGGRTYLGNGVKPFARVLVGNGNNGKDGFEGAVWKNCLACYYHGPFLSKNVHLADWLIKTALEVKYRVPVELDPLDDQIEWAAHNFLLKRAGISPNQNDQKTNTHD